MRIRNFLPVLMLFLAACASAASVSLAAQKSCEEKGVSLSLPDGWHVQHGPEETANKGFFEICGIVSNDGTHEIYFGYQKVNRSGFLSDAQVIGMYTGNYMRRWSKVSPARVIKKVAFVKGDLKVKKYNLQVTGKVVDQTRSYYLGFASIRIKSVPGRVYYMTSSPMKNQDGKKSSWKYLSWFLGNIK